MAENSDKQAIEVVNNEAEGQFEALVEGHLALAAYQRKGQEIIFTHTEVPQALEGQGIASVLVRTALDTARQQQLTVVPLCPFVQSYIRRHQEYLDIVEPSHRERLQRNSKS